MKKGYGIRKALIATVGILPLIAASSITPVRFDSESRVWVDGTSTVRSYSCRATQVSGAVQGEGTLSLAQLEATVRGAEVNVPVASLECGNATMNSHLRNALKASEHPTIRFQLDTHSVTAASEAAGTAQIGGRLRIAGQEKPFTVEATVTREANGAVRVVGSKEILMTQFGVRPPSLMLGTMKVRDPVVINFNVLLKAS